MLCHHASGICSFVVVQFGHSNIDFFRANGWLWSLQVFDDVVDSEEVFGDLRTIGVVGFRVGCCKVFEMRCPRLEHQFYVRDECIIDFEGIVVISGVGALMGNDLDLRMFYLSTI